MLKSLPLRIGRQQLLSQLPERTDELKELFRTHDDPKDGYKDCLIPVYGDGTQERDFTYIDDIARGSIAGLKPLSSSSGQVGFEVINLGSDRPVKLNHVIQLIEQYLGKKAQIEFQPRHPADVPATWADISKAKRLLGWQPLVCQRQQQNIK